MLCPGPTLEGAPTWRSRHRLSCSNIGCREPLFLQNYSSRALPSSKAGAPLLRTREPLSLQNYTSRALPSKLFLPIPQDPDRLLSLKSDEGHLVEKQNFNHLDVDIKISHLTQKSWYHGQEYRYRYGCTHIYICLDFACSLSCNARPSCSCSMGQ